jgi:hypothetical protein
MSAFRIVLQSVLRAVIYHQKSSYLTYKAATDRSQEIERHRLFYS